GLLKDVLKTHIKPRWKSPKGYGPKKAKDGADDDGAVAKGDKADKADKKKKRKKKTAQR
ncbi:MAG: hypothetical protein HOV80_22015, partial [Polyangiaceae bacterium]|nr:hypothetical protein [Polyangiaceae bacterium]